VYIIFCPPLTILITLYYRLLYAGAANKSKARLPFKKKPHYSLFIAKSAPVKDFIKIKVTERGN